MRTVYLGIAAIFFVTMTENADAAGKPNCDLGEPIERVLKCLNEKIIELENSGTRAVRYGDGIKLETTVGNPPDTKCLSNDDQKDNLESGDRCNQDDPFFVVENPKPRRK